MSTQDRFNQRLKESAMSEQKHTPGPKETWMTHGYSVYMNDGNGNTTWICDCKTKELAELIARAPELLQQVAELTKENADLLAKVSELKRLLDDVLNDVQYADHKIDKDLYNEIKKALE